MELQFGHTARWGRFVTAEIPLGHTFALRPIAKGAETVEYAVTTGIATRAIGVGEYAHVRNVRSARWQHSVA